MVTDRASPQDEVEVPRHQPTRRISVAGHQARRDAVDRVARVGEDVGPSQRVDLQKLQGRSFGDRTG